MVEYEGMTCMRCEYLPGLSCKYSLCHLFTESFRQVSLLLAQLDLASQSKLPRGATGI